MNELIDPRDHLAVSALLYAYARSFDGNDPDGVAALFTDDCEIDYGPEFAPIRGRAAVVPSIAPGLRERFAATSHHISNVWVEPTDSGADVVAYVYAWHRYRDGSPDSELWGQYHATAVRVADGWRLRSLRLLAAGSYRFHRERMHPTPRRPVD